MEILKRWIAEDHEGTGRPDKTLDFYRHWRHWITDTEGTEISGQKMQFKKIHCIFQQKYAVLNYSIHGTSYV